MAYNINENWNKYIFYYFLIRYVLNIYVFNEQIIIFIYTPYIWHGQKLMNYIWQHSATAWVDMTTMPPNTYQYLSIHYKLNMIT